MEPYVGEIRTFAFNQIPKGWMPCEGQLLPVQSYQALYSLIGIVYGGTIQVNFNLPDLRGRVTINNGASSVSPGTYYTNGNVGGVENVALTANQMPAHMHTVNVVNGNANTFLADGNAIAGKQQTANLTNENINAFIGVPNPPLVPLHPATVSSIGGAPHENRMPYISLQVCIAVTGLYPIRP